MADVQRLDAHTIAGQHDTVLRFHPQCDGEHTAEARETLLIPLDEGTEHSFSIGVGLKAVAALLEFTANFEVIVDFAVEDDTGVAIFRKDGLIAAVEIDDLEAGRSHREQTGLEDTQLVRATMGQRGGDFFDAVRWGEPVLSCESGYATQMRGLSRVLDPGRLRRAAESRIQPTTQHFMWTQQDTELIQILYTEVAFGQMR
jgi:hypothetical protein